MHLTVIGESPALIGDDLTIGLSADLGGPSGSRFFRPNNSLRTLNKCEPMLKLGRRRTANWNKVISWSTATWQTAVWGFFTLIVVVVVVVVPLQQIFFGLMFRSTAALEPAGEERPSQATKNSKQ
jgi:hypothetical protein